MSRSAFAPERRAMDTVRNQSRYAVQPDWRNLLEKLVVQIQAGEPRDQMEHRLTNNVHYLGATRALGLDP